MMSVPVVRHRPLRCLSRWVRVAARRGCQRRTPLGKWSAQSTSLISRSHRRPRPPIPCLMTIWLSHPAMRPRSCLRLHRLVSVLLSPIPESYALNESHSLHVRRLCVLQRTDPLPSKEDPGNVRRQQVQSRWGSICLPASRPLIQTRVAPVDVRRRKSMNFIHYPAPPSRCLRHLAQHHLLDVALCRRYALKCHRARQCPRHVLMQSRKDTTQQRHGAEFAHQQSLMRSKRMPTCQLSGAHATRHRHHEERKWDNNTCPNTARLPRHQPRGFSSWRRLSRHMTNRKKNASHG